MEGTEPLARNARMPRWVECTRSDRRRPKVTEHASKKFAERDVMEVLCLPLSGRQKMSLNIGQACRRGPPSSACPRDPFALFGFPVQARISPLESFFLDRPTAAFR